MNISLGPKQYGIIGLALITAVIHLILGVQAADILFLLNGLGYIGLVGMLYLPLAFLSSGSRLNWAAANRKLGRRTTLELSNYEKEM